MVFDYYLIVKDHFISGPSTPTAFLIFNFFHVAWYSNKTKPLISVLISNLNFAEGFIHSILLENSLVTTVQIEHLVMNVSLSFMC